MAWSILDTLSAALLIGATVWFFGLQSPFLLRLMGRDSFIPIQMQLTRRFLTFAVCTAAAMSVAAFSRTDLSLHTKTVAWIALASSLATRFLILPRAFQAAGKARREGAAPNPSATSFVSDGAGRSARLMHRVVVGFVALMLLSTIGHVMHLVLQP